jgi:hypothetical protein
MSKKVVLIGGTPVRSLRAAPPPLTRGRWLDGLVVQKQFSKIVIQHGNQDCQTHEAWSQLLSDALDN